MEPQESPLPAFRADGRRSGLQAVCSSAKLNGRRRELRERWRVVVAASSVHDRPIPQSVTALALALGAQWLCVGCDGTETLTAADTLDGAVCPFDVYWPCARPTGESASIGQTVAARKFGPRRPTAAVGGGEGGSSARALVRYLVSKPASTGTGPDGDDENAQLRRPPAPPPRWPKSWMWTCPTCRRIGCAPRCASNTSSWNILCQSRCTGT